MKGCAPQHALHVLSCRTRRADLLSERRPWRRRALQVGIEKRAIFVVHMGGDAYRARLRTAGAKSQWLAEMYEAVLGAMFLEGGFLAVCATLQTRFPLPAGLMHV